MRGHRHETGPNGDLSGSSDLVNSPQGGDLDVHAFTYALAEAGVLGEAIADCFRTDSGVCLGSSL